MKKFFLLSFIFMICLVPLKNCFHVSFAEEVIYAKISDEEVYLYSTPSNNDKNRLFLLPSTYFVKLLNKANEEFYYCSYKDITGYVKQSEVVAMKGTPSSPYLEGLFRIISLEGLGLYSSPQLNESNLLATIPYLTDDLVYYGIMAGQELVPDNSNKWIYCKYNDESGICGFVYSTFCDKVPKETINTESYEIIDHPFASTTEPHELSSVAMGFIIIGVAVPCLIVLFLLVKPTMLKDKITTIKPKLRAKRNRDYFEFDDSDLN